MKKYIFSFILIIALSLSALYLFESKDVNAVDVTRYQVRFELTSQQIAEGVTFADGTIAYKNAYFDNVNGFYQIINGSMVTSSLYPNRGYMPGSSINTSVTNQFFSFVRLTYNAVPSLYEVTNFRQTAWFNDLFISQIDTTDTFVFRYTFREDDLDCSFTYYTSPTQSVTYPGTYVRSWSLGECSTNPQWTGGSLQPPSFENMIFSGWKINNQLYTYNDLFNFYSNTSFSAVAQYVTSDTTYTVSFYDGLNLIGSQSYPYGIGTISPPFFNFGVGQSLLGWSNRLGGSILNLSTFNLKDDLVLYAIKEFNSNSTINSGSFEIPYQDCGNFDIPCHLGNAFIYFLNEFPLVSDIATFIYPIGDFLNEFPQYFQLFESLGFFFTFSMGILLMTFIFRLMR